MRKISDNLISRTTNKKGKLARVVGKQLRLYNTFYSVRLDSQFQLPHSAAVKSSSVNGWRAKNPGEPAMGIKHEKISTVAEGIYRGRKVGARKLAAMCKCSCYPAFPPSSRCGVPGRFAHCSIDPPRSAAQPRVCRGAEQ